MQLPAKLAASGLQTREQFHAALAHVNALVKQQDITADEAKACMTKAQALRAWASFDKRLTVKEKQEANRALARTVIMLSELAGREQPVMSKPRGRGSLPGPVAWLRRELALSYGRAKAMRVFAADLESQRHVLDAGLHWGTVIRQGPRRSASMLGRASTWMTATNSARAALAVSPNNLSRELTCIRKIIAWAQAYEASLVQCRARAKKEAI